MQTASKSLKKRRSNSLTTSQSTGTGHASYRERLSLSRFESVDLPSSCTSLVPTTFQTTTAE